MIIFQKFNLRRKVRLVELADIFINEMKLTRNDIVLVHSSLRNINLIDSQPQDLIYFLKMIVGADGALLMPEFENIASNVPNDEDPNEERSNINRYNILNEIFSQMTDVTKIGNPSELLSVWGKIPKYFTSGHLLDEVEANKKNLLYELSLMKAKIIGFGVPFDDLTFLNISETNFYFSQDIILKYFKEDEIKLFKKGGIQYFWADAEKYYQRALVLANR